MPKKYVVFFKSVGRRWFYFIVAIIIIIFFINQEFAIWVTGITIILFALTYIKPARFAYRFRKLVKQYYMIEDDTIAKELNIPIKNIRERMFYTTQRQLNKKRYQFWIRIKKWLIIYLNKRYYFYHHRTVDKFLEYYHRGFDEKELLEELRDHDLTSKVEIKTIGENLRKMNRLGPRKISIKERRDSLKYT